MYVDKKTRDRNGNIKDPIGERIDLIDSTKLYMQDIEHERKLQKLSQIKKKSMSLYRKSQSKSRDGDQLILPKITTPIEPKGLEKDAGIAIAGRKLLEVPSYKSPLDEVIRNKRTM